MKDEAERELLLERIKKAEDDHRQDRRRLVEQLERKTKKLLICEGRLGVAKDALNCIFDAECYRDATVKKCSAHAEVALNDIHRRGAADG